MHENEREKAQKDITKHLELALGAAVHGGVVGYLACVDGGGSGHGYRFLHPF